MLREKQTIGSKTKVLQYRVADFSGPQIIALSVALTLLISIPIWTHPLPPLSDYVNHLARMHVLATLHKNPQLARFYEIDWQIIPNLTMDLIVPLLARFMSVYLAGQIFIVGMFALTISGVMALNRTLTGRWTVFPLFALPLVYNYVFLVGLMNYIFGIAIALWALAGWVLYLLIPKSAEISFPAFLGLFIAAQIGGLASQIPGGVGVFDSIVLATLTGRGVPAPDALSCLVAAAPHLDNQHVDARLPGIGN